MTQMRRRRGLGDTNPLALAAYTRGIEASQSNAAEWPYNWLFPPAHSRHVLSQGSAPVPDYTGGPASTIVLQYQVPDGMRFCLRGVVISGANIQSWNQGSGDLTFTLSVISGGTRNVDFLANITTELGSFNQGPFPIGGRLEFESLDILAWNMTANANVGIGSPNLGICALWGHTYPTSESDNG
jgi:hypothetical protein